jgi:Phage integrase family
MKVTVMARVREGNKYPFVDPVWQGNKLKPGAVIVKDATGKKIEVKRDDVSYYLRYTRHGKQVTEPAGKSPKDVLTFRERILARLEAEALGLAVSGGNIVPMPQSTPDSFRTTIQQAVADFLTRKAQDPDLRRSTVGGYANTLGQWLGWCRKQNLDEVVRDDVWGFRTHLWKTAKKTNGKPYAERTANKTQEVASFLNDVGCPGLLTARDWQMMDPGPSTRIPYSKDEIKALRAACETEDARDVIEFYPGLGLRKGEGYQTKWTDVDFTNRYIRVGVSYQTKDKDPRNVPMGPALIERLKARRKRHPDTVYVFKPSESTW